MERKISDAELDRLITEALEMTDDQLADLMDQAKLDAELEGQLSAKPPQGGFEDVMKRVAESEKEERSVSKVVRVKKVLRPLLVVAVLGTIVLGAGIGVSGQREFEFIKRIRSEYSMGYNNTESLTNNTELELAYQRICDEIGIRPVMLNYMPAELRFEGLKIDNGRATITFECKGKYVYLQQTLRSKDSSYNSISDRIAYKVIEHRRLGKIDVYYNELQDGQNEYSAALSNDNAYYYISGFVEEDEFIKVVERLNYYE